MLQLLLLLLLLTRRQRRGRRRRGRGGGGGGGSGGRGVVAHISGGKQTVKEDGKIKLSRDLWRCVMETLQGQLGFGHNYHKRIQF